MPWDDYDDVRFVLDQHSPRVDMSLHSDTLFWFWANQSLLLPRAVYYYGISVIVPDFSFKIRITDLPPGITLPGFVQTCFFFLVV